MRSRGSVKYAAVLITHCDPDVTRNGSGVPLIGGLSG